MREYGCRSNRGTSSKRKQACAKQSGGKPPHSKMRALSGPQIQPFCVRGRRGGGDREKCDGRRETGQRQVPPNELRLGISAVNGIKDKRAGRLKYSARWGLLRKTRSSRDGQTQVPVVIDRLTVGQYNQERDEQGGCGSRARNSRPRRPWDAEESGSLTCAWL